MKNPYKILILLFAVLLFMQCNTVDKLTEFDISYSYEYDLPESPGIDIPLDLYTPGLETDSEDVYELHDTRKDLVEEVYLKEVKLKITMPEDGKFDFLRTVKIYIRAMDTEETLIAWKEEISDGQGPVLYFNTTSKDLQKYLKKDQIVFRFNTLTDDPIEQDMKIQIHSIFHVNAKILGI